MLREALSDPRCSGAALLGRTSKLLLLQVVGLISRLLGRTSNIASHVSARDKLAYLLEAHKQKKSSQQETRDLAPEEEVEKDPKPVQILGMSSSLCSSCGSADVVTDRVFTELGHLYCERCWGVWERCGWWKPSLRVSTTQPRLGPRGLPEVSAEDAFFLPAFLCGHEDLSLMERLKEELLVEGKDFSDWHGSRHMGLHFEKRSGAEACSARAELVKRMEDTFGIRASAVRLNLYRSNRDYKPLHYDRGRDSEGVPQMTVGASFGAARELTFMHVKSGVTVSFPQCNGDVFAFTPEINEVFMHGVPRVRSNLSHEPDNPRMSLIIWGARVSAPA